MRVPVIAGDINDRPYRVVGAIETNVRKWTIFEKDPSQQSVYRELWERARKLGADAVVNAKYGETLYGGLTWGRRHATGQAIKFLSEVEISALPPQRKAQPIVPVVSAQQQPQIHPSAPKKRATVTCITCN